MPTPKPGEETEGEWMARCVPMMMDEGNGQDQAVAMCMDMWREATEGKSAMPLARAFSFIEIKAIEEDARIIRGVASTPTPDRLNDVVQPMGAKFELPIPHLWQHKHDQPIGHVIEAKPNKNAIPFVSQIAKTDEPGPLKELLDMAWQSMKMGLVRAVSIGFSSIKHSFLDNGGIEFQEWNWYELSSVTIPAQPEATITSVKQLDRIYREVAGIPEFEYPEIPAPLEPAASGKEVRVVRLNEPLAPEHFVVRRIIRT